MVDKEEVRCQAYSHIDSLEIPQISAMFPNYLSLQFQHGGLQHEEKLAVGSDGRLAGYDQRTEDVFCWKCKSVPLFYVQSLILL
ncbi:MAG: hypothetical protein V2B20_22325 [Pseudomonadota bacterium]